MKKILMACFALALTGALQAQQQQGRIVYEYTMDLEIFFNGMTVSVNVPPAIKEVLFANNKSIIRQIPSTGDPGKLFNEDNQIALPDSASGDVVTFTDLQTGAYTQTETLADKKYLIVDTVSKLTWTLTGETKTILGYNCQQAIAQRTRTLRQENSGEEIISEMTEHITAWFAPSIPVPAGPELQAQLPGLLLELDINNGKISYKALEIATHVALEDIKEPVIGTKVTEKAFSKLLRQEQVQQPN